ncbi:MAG: universal stress protein [Dehalococcoidales bacterium]|nr:universal stress protein [Dehalococcoidales bacterium]
MLEKILIPLDGSSLGEMALVQAKELAVAFSSEIHLVSVCEKQDSEYRRMVQLYTEKVTEQLQSDLKKSSLTVTVKFAVLDGSPAAEIVDYAQKKRISLVVIVSHGHSGIMPWSMGSTANKVVHSAYQPVLLVRASMFSARRRPVKLFNKVLVPLDGSEAGEAALPYVSEIAQKLKSEVTLLSVVEASQHIRTVGGQDYIHYPEQQVESMKIETNRYLAITTKKLADSGVNVRSIVREGNAAAEIIKFAREGNIRLIAMSSHGRSGMRGWVFGSVSNKVLQAGKTPLLLVRAPQMTGK